ncbi:MULTISPECIES: VanZ family protein [unclassified Sutcliffiella]|uniref:VanZ family protein n=1 Tax=unclassified Sutcliffiella TaxID=2837532 RepID=UPI0030CDBA85
MRLEEITGILSRYFELALIAVVVIGAVLAVGYFFVYRKLLGGKKRLSIKRWLVGGMFTGYIIMVLGVTFLSRGPGFENEMNLSLFYSYRDAWYTFSVRPWQFVILNIVMFVPLGILLPLLHPRFQKAAWTLGASFLFTLFIESTQYVTKFGRFVVDDLFNNFIGGVIGYGICMGVMKLREKRVKPAILYFSPMLLVVAMFGGIFGYYHLKEFGNLAIVPAIKVDMSKAYITTDVEFDDRKVTSTVYKAPFYTQEEGDALALDLFDRMGVDTSDLETIYYPNEGIYRAGTNGSYSLWFYGIDGSYNYWDWSANGESVEPKEVEEEDLRGELVDFGIVLPAEASFKQVEDSGHYNFTVDKLLDGDNLIDGNLTVGYYSDDTIKVIDNSLITYEKVRDIEMKSEQEAYEQILKGKFRHFSHDRKLERLHIYDVTVSYFLDSKGYYQPVYAFYSELDGEEVTILVPGI